jgi:capsule polysaccharide export protein KpsE/RkpR
VDAYLTYTHAIVDIFKNNMNSCESALLQVKAYTEKNKANIMQMKEKFESMTKNMSDEEKKKYEQRVKESLGDSMKVMMQFGQKCPQEMVKASVALEFLE